MWVLRMDDGENRFNRTSIDALHGALDQVAATDGPCALVTTGTGKFYSNGLDLDWLGAGVGTEGFLDDVHRLFGRVLGPRRLHRRRRQRPRLRRRGHAGASAHDAVVMREDRGYWCLPEVDLGAASTPAMYAHRRRPPAPARRSAEAALTGRRYGGPDAVAAGIAAAAVPRPTVLSTGGASLADRAGRQGPQRAPASTRSCSHAEALRACGV